MFSNFQVSKPKGPRHRDPFRRRVRRPPAKPLIPYHVLSKERANHPITFPDPCDDCRQASSWQAVETVCLALNRNSPEISARNLIGR